MDLLFYQVLKLLFSFTLETCVLDVFFNDLSPVTFYHLVFWSRKLFLHIDFWKILDWLLFIFLMVNSKFSILWRLSHHFLPELQKLIKGINILHFCQFLFTELLLNWIHSLGILRPLPHLHLLLWGAKRFLGHFDISQEGLKVIFFDRLKFLLDNFLDKNEFLCFWDIQKVFFIVFLKAKQG